MSRRELATRAAVGAGAVVCLALAVGLALLAVDIARWRDALPAGDVRYRAAPGTTELWRPATLIPRGTGEAMLDVGDDVAFRLAVQALRGARLGNGTASGPGVALQRNEAQARLEAIAAGKGQPMRRSRAANLLGVLGLARLVTETEDRQALLQSTIASLQFAIALDPGNEEAKFNLELALQRSRGNRLAESSSGSNPSPGGTGAKGAGAGQPGSGY